MYRNVKPLLHIALSCSKKSKRNEKKIYKMRVRVWIEEIILIQENSEKSQYDINARD